MISCCDLDNGHSSLPPDEVTSGSASWIYVDYGNFSYLYHHLTNWIECYRAATQCLGCSICYKIDSIELFSRVHSVKSQDHWNL